MTNVKSGAKSYKVRPVPINQATPAPPGVGQREKVSQAHIDYLAANMDLNALGHPCINHRNGKFIIFDGQHRIEALRKCGFGDELLDCRVYEDFTDEEMAEMFLNVNTSKAVDAYSKFMNTCAAGHATECDVRRIVESNGLRFSRAREDNAIGAVSACLTTYNTHGPTIFGRTLRILRDAYGGAAVAFESNIIIGLGHVLGRYLDTINDKRLVELLSQHKQGPFGILRVAEQARLRVGSRKSTCVAATIVDIYNKTLRVKLPSWWQNVAAL